MLSFTSRLSPDADAFAIFVNEKYDYSDKKGVLSKNGVQKINSFLNELKIKKKDLGILVFRVVGKQETLYVNNFCTGTKN